MILGGIDVGLSSGSNEVNEVSEVNEVNV